MPTYAAEQTLRREFSVSSELELIRSVQSQDGEEMPADMMPSVERSSTWGSTLSVIDKIQSVDESGTPTFERSYETVSGQSTFDTSMDGAGDFDGMEPISEESELESELEGQAVLFAPSEDGYSAAPGEDSDVSQETADSLRADLSMGFLLPDEPVSEGESWTIEGSEIALLLAPLGHLPMDESDSMGMFFGVPAESDEKSYDGDITLTHGGEKDVDGTTYVLIQVKVDCSSDWEFENEIMMMAEGDEEAEPAISEGEATDVYEGAGELLWDPKASLIHSLELSLEHERSKAETMSFEIPGAGAIDILTEEVEEGSLEISMTASAL